MPTPVRIVLQARLDSSRLPAKALLPVAGYPAAVLAALRAGRDGAETVIATSDRPSDDPLAAAVRAHGIAVFRGDRDDVLGRILGACADLPDEAVVVRLTGDNPVPDADYVMMMAAGLLRSGGAYFATAWPEDGLPYGVSTEAVRLGALRRSYETDRSPANLEHVTTVLRRAGPGPRDPDWPRDSLAHLRCTIDAFDDYLRILALFDGVADPVGIPWRDLVARLAALPGMPPRPAVGAGLVLGTAQLAAPYGSVRETRPPAAEDAVALVRRAIDGGAAWIDTARAYAGSEARLGLALDQGWQARVQVATKLSPLAEVPADAAPAAAAAQAEISVLQSCRALRLPRLPALLLHRAEHRTGWGGQAWSRLKALRDDGVIGALGVSAQTPQEALAAFDDPDVAHLQLPLNLLDPRWAAAGVAERRRARPEVRLHVRSAFLQGILLRPAADWPRIDGVDPAAVLAWLAAEAARLGRSGPADLCLAYLRSLDWVDGIVVGMETPEQLERNLELFARPALDPAERAEVEAGRPQVPERLLTPALWR